MAKATEISLTLEDRNGLERTVNSSRSEVRDAFRAKIVLLSAEGKSTAAIASKLGTSPQTVSLWRVRFAREGIAGLRDRPGRGRKRTYTADKVEAIVQATLTSKPEASSRWSTRQMAKAMGVSHTTVHRIWKAHGLKPQLVR